MRNDLSREERTYAVAVSVSSSPAGKGIWGMLTRLHPADVYGRVSAGGSPPLQSYLAERYPEDPLEAAKRIIDDAEKKSIHVLTYWDTGYPAMLREIAAPPIALYLKGGAPAGPAVAVVGSRKSDHRSSSNARRIARDLAARGYAVVSGMAVGVDREAHMGAMDAGGSTVGVLANGIDIVYPWQNRDVYRRIEDLPGSALLSEYPPGTIAGRWTFVRRNRIISGLCAGTVVVKAGERSGALITARHALDQNREVFACAGHSFNEEYAGCHRLIQNGAILVSSTEDILAEIAGFYGCEPPPPSGGENGSGSRASPESFQCEDVSSALGERIIGLLSDGEHDIDSLVRATASAPGEIQEAVVALELEGRIIRNGNIVTKS